MLIAQWQYAVTRKDMAETFSFKDFKEYGGNLVIPADRFSAPSGLQALEGPEIWSLRRQVYTRQCKQGS
ncbi:hypothetical protein GBA52_028652 [Prunus armeniaca]|nr:hypothetical protein GBA52_028652 [Prunus armeniaca]